MRWLNASLLPAVRVDELDDQYFNYMISIHGGRSMIDQCIIQIAAIFNTLLVLSMIWQIKVWVILFLLQTVSLKSPPAVMVI